MPTRLNPLAVEIMAEKEMGISKQKSKGLEGFLGKDFDYVITVCDNARESCPVFPGKAKYIHWSIKDPARAKGKKEKTCLFQEGKRRDRKKDT